MAPSLTGRVIVISGAARGIGLATAEKLASDGAQVVIGDLDLDTVNAAVDQIGNGAIGARLDVTDPASWSEFLDATASSGPCDTLVNNAGIMPIGPLLNEPDALTRAVFDVNVLGYIFGIRAITPQMLDLGRGHIVNVASAVGRLPLAGGATYSASKAAVIAFSEAFRDELRGGPIKVSVVLPTAVETELAAGIARARGVKHLTPDEVAAAIHSVIHHPRPEVSVPRSSGVMMKTSALLPRGVRNALSHAMRADAVLSEADGSARQTYEKGLRDTFGGK